MAWQREVSLAAQALASLLARGPAEVDLDVAVTARAAVLDHVTHVLGDLAPRTRHPRATNGGRDVPLALVEADPIRALGLVLRRRAQPEVDRRPSELLDNRWPVDPATADWVEVGRRAILADRYWAGPAVGNLEPAAAWHAVGEIAALAEAIAVLDNDLAATGGNRPDVAGLLASTGGLRLAARETLALAAPEDPARPGPSHTSETPPVVLSPAEGIATRGARPSTLAKETRRLTILLDETIELTPHHIRACAQVARNLCVLAAAGATSFTGADLRQELSEVARALHAAATRDRGEFAINPVPARALELQLRDLHASTKLALARGGGLDGVEANSVARRLPDLVEILGEKTHAQIEHGRWAVPDRREGDCLPYAFASRTDPELTPPMLAGVRRAADAVGVLRSQVALPPDGAGRAIAVSLAASLHAAGAARSATSDRPLHPDLPITDQSAQARSLTTSESA